MLTGAQAGATNLIINGSFEDPKNGAAPQCIQGAASWFYCSSDNTPGWTVKWSGTYLPGQLGNLEFHTQATLGFTPTDGLQYAELATAPGAANDDRRVNISQSIAMLCPLDSYTLSFDARKREADDILKVVYDGVVVANAPTVLGAWTSFSYIFTPSNSTIMVEFEETGGADTLGTLIDNIKLVNNMSFSACNTSLDAKPGSNPNAVNLCSGGGVVPVAFVGTEFFNPYDYTILGVSLATDQGTGEFVVGKGKSDVCKIEDVVDGTNPAEITPDGFPDVVCHIPTMDMSDVVDTTGESLAEVKVCLTLSDGGDPFTICATDELKLARTCE